MIDLKSRLLKAIFVFGEKSGPLREKDLRPLIEKLIQCAEACEHYCAVKAQVRVDADFHFTPLDVKETPAGAAVAALEAELKRIEEK